MFSLPSASDTHLNSRTERLETEAARKPEESQKAAEENA